MDRSQREQRRQQQDAEDETVRGCVSWISFQRFDPLFGCAGMLRSSAAWSRFDALMAFSTSLIRGC